MGRGVNSRMIADLNQPWGASESCTSCGKCVQVCPTGALFTKGRYGGRNGKAARLPALDPRPAVKQEWSGSCE